MTDTKMQSNGNVRLRVHASNAFSNYKWPTVAELNAGLRLEDAVPWDGFDFGIQASDTASTPPLSAKSIVESRSTANYGGGIPFWYPGYYDDASNQLSEVYDFFNPSGFERVVCYISMSVDGEIGEVGQPADTYLYAAGDFTSLYRVQAGAWDDMTEGDDPFYYTLNFLRNGALAAYTVAGATSTPTVVIPTTLATNVGLKSLLAATVNTRPYNAGLTWSTSAPAVATVSQYGVVTALTAGTATITAAAPNSTATATCAVTVAV